jgi:tetratricopeptide (TPR) repeat protein
MATQHSAGVRANSRPDRRMRPSARLPIHHNLGNTLRAKGRLDEAVAEYRQAIAFDPKNVPAHTNLGNVLADKGRLEEAVAEYRQAMAIDPKLAEPHGAMGQALLRQGR